jgi:hypothetical protein
MAFAAPALSNRKFLTITTSNSSNDEYHIIMAVFNAQVRIWVLIAANMALIAAASFALGAKRHWRVLNLLRYKRWVSTVSRLIVMIFLVGCPKLTGIAFSTTSAFLDMFQVSFRH